MKGITLFFAASTLALSALAAPPSGRGGGATGAAAPSHIGANGDFSTRPAVSAGRYEQRDLKTSGRTPSEILANNTKVASQIHDLTDADAQQACTGFKNVGECVAAAHVSKNLGIEFDALRAKLTGSGSESLGDAIHDLKPDANAKSETRKARSQARDDLKSLSGE